jgi:hypothetical protein
MVWRSGYLTLRLWAFDFAPWWLDHGFYLFQLSHQWQPPPFYSQNFTIRNILHSNRVHEG